jgi:hypothetical protein
MALSLHRPFRTTATRIISSRRNGIARRSLSALPNRHSPAAATAHAFDYDARDEVERNDPVRKPLTSEQRRFLDGAVSMFLLYLMAEYLTVKSSALIKLASWLLF